MTALAPLPVSTATNAYERMEEVNRAILEEPARLNMDSWWLAYQDVKDAQFWWGCRNKKVSAPACGTIGCYAGWVTFFDGDHRKGVGIEYTALNTLAGGDIWSPLRKELTRAFGECTVRDDYDNKISPGTRAYARAVVKRFRAIMKEYEKELRAVPIVRAE